MAERPIIFHGRSVRAILAGTKSQTRRVVKLDRWMQLAGMNINDPRVRVDTGLGHPDSQYLKVPKDDDDTVHRLRAPWSPGTRLWVRETWVHDKMPDGREAVVYRAGCDEHDTFNYVESDGTVTCLRVGPWRSPIHMPRWACRLVLEVVAVRVERVASISVEDAIAEGVDETLNYPQDEYAKMWNATNRKKPGCAWEDNPFVWVVEFKRVEEATNA